jgi:hypothetical protein
MYAPFAEQSERINFAAMNAKRNGNKFQLFAIDVENSFSEIDTNS